MATTNKIMQVAAGCGGSSRVRRRTSRRTPAASTASVAETGATVGVSAVIVRAHMMLSGDVKGRFP
jgi:hypothetical protein